MHSCPSLSRGSRYGPQLRNFAEGRKWYIICRGFTCARSQKLWQQGKSRQMTEVDAPWLLKSFLLGDCRSIAHSPDCALVNNALIILSVILIDGALTSFSVVLDNQASSSYCLSWTRSPLSLWRWSMTRSPLSL